MAAPVIAATVTAPNRVSAPIQRIKAVHLVVAPWGNLGSKPGAKAAGKKKTTPKTAQAGGIKPGRTQHDQTR